MIITDILIVLSLVVGIVSYCIGFYFGQKANPKADEYVYNRPDGTKIIKKQPMRELNSIKPRGIFHDTSDIPSGAVQRPSASQIESWNEDPKVKGQKKALSESFANDPGLAELRRLKEEYEKTIQR